MTRSGPPPKCGIFHTFFLTGSLRCFSLTSFGFKCQFYRDTFNRRRQWKYGELRFNLYNFPNNVSCSPAKPSTKRTLPQLSTVSWIHGQGNAPHRPITLASGNCQSQESHYTSKILALIKGYKIRTIRNNFPL